AALGREIRSGTYGYLNPSCDLLQDRREVFVHEPWGGAERLTNRDACEGDKQTVRDRGTGPGDLLRLGHGGVKGPAEVPRRHEVTFELPRPANALRLQVVRELPRIRLEVHFPA